MTDDNESELRPGTVVFTPAGVPHIHALDEQTEVEYVYATRTGHGTQVQQPATQD